MQVGASTASSLAPPEKDRQAVKTLDKNAFLQLFIAQLKNQDPTAPQDANAFMAQMTSFGILEQLFNLNSEIVQLRRSQEMAEASLLLGKQVSVDAGDYEITGPVEKVSYSGGMVRVFVDGFAFSLAQVTEISERW